MAELSYSDGALNVINNFYGVEKMLYVEGVDDVVFWESILDKFDVGGYKVQSVEGKQELNKKVDKITGGVIEAIAAKDLDFSILDVSYEEHSSVITTYAHSIENTIFCKKVISKVIRTLGRLKASSVSESDCSHWLEIVHASFHNLIVYDAINELKAQGLAVLGDNCTRFMDSKKSPIPSSSDIDSYISAEGFGEKLDGYIDEATSLINGSGKKVSDFLRGHFLFSAVVKYINKAIASANSSKQASYDGVFGCAILAFESTLDESHPHYSHYSSEMDKILLAG